MSAISPRKLFERLGEQLYKGVAAVLSVGLNRLCWPVAIGLALGALVLEQWPGVAGWVHKKHGGAAVALAFAGLLLGGTFAASRFMAEPHRFSRASRGVQRALGLVLLGPLLLALSSGLERNHEFMVLGLAVATAWVVARVLRAWMPEDRIRLPMSVTEAQLAFTLPASSPKGVAGALRHWPIAMLGALVAAYTVTMSWLSIANHMSFNTSRADLGFYVSIFRRSSLGDPLGCTICGGGNHLSGHFDPILVLLSPLYLLYPEAETILVLQSLLLGSTMVPLYLLGKAYGVSPIATLLVCACFGLHPALHGVNLFDFHSLALVIPAAVWVLWARDTGRLKTYWALFVVMLLVREDAALIAIVIGADTVLRRDKTSVLMGVTTIGIAALYFVGVKVGLMSNADPLNSATGRGYAYYYQELVPKGTGTMGLVTTVLSDPAKVLELLASEAKVLYWLQLLVPVLGLPLLAGRGRLLLAYGALFTLLASRKHVYSLHFHYSSVVLPFLFYLCIVALSRPRTSTRLLAPLLGKGRLGKSMLQLLICVTALSCTAVVGWRFGGMFPNRSFVAGFRPLSRSPTEADFKRDRALKAICRAVPKGAVVAANEPNLPHLGRCAGYQVKKRRLQADYLAWTTTDGPKQLRNPTHQAIQKEIRKGYWTKVGTYGGFDLFKNTAPEDARKPKKSKRAKPTSKGQVKERPTTKPPRAKASTKPSNKRAPDRVPPAASQDAGFEGSDPDNDDSESSE